MTDREKFEAWASDNTELSLVRTAYAFTEYDDQQYMDHDSNLAWMAYQAALASQQPADDGWIEWGGKCEGNDQPVAGIVEVKFRGGEIEKDKASAWYWPHAGVKSDIIAYRVVKP